MSDWPWPVGLPIEPCPFCGEHAPGRVFLEVVGAEICGHCESCLAEGPPRDTEMEAAVAWNERDWRGEFEAKR